MTYPLPNTSYNLSDQIAFVTGASSGLGYRFAKVLASAGAKVAVAGRRKDRLDAVVEEIRSNGGTAEAIVLDVAEASTIPAAVQRAERALGLVTILINNAGVPGTGLPTQMSLEQIDQIINVNLRAPFLLSREVARRLIEEDKPGRIVNISSIAAYNCSTKGASLYTTTKAAVVRLTEALAVEWAVHHINVNGIAPGSFDSEMMDEMRHRVGDEFIQRFPRKRLGNPAQLDSTLLYLVSPSSETVTGTIIKVDDGQQPR